MNTTYHLLMEMASEQERSAAILKSQRSDKTLVSYAQGIAAGLKLAAKTMEHKTVGTETASRDSVSAS